MKVAEHSKAAFLMLLDYGFLHCLDGRVPLRTGLLIEAIKVKSVRVKAPVAARYSIWIQAWHNFEAVIAK